MAGFSIDIKGLQKTISALDGAGKGMKKATAQAARLAALAVEREIVLGIRSGAPGGKALKPLSPMTLSVRRMKGIAGTAPLIASSAMLGSVKTTSRGQESFVGVHRGARTATGESVVSVAAAQEFGTEPFVIPVTEGVRSFFWALFFASNGDILPISPSKTEIFHPGLEPRPFIRPAVEKLQKSGKLDKVLKIVVRKL